MTLLEVFAAIATFAVGFLVYERVRRNRTITDNVVSLVEERRTRETLALQEQLRRLEQESTRDTETYKKLKAEYDAKWRAKRTDGAGDNGSSDPSDSK